MYQLYTSMPAKKVETLAASLCRSPYCLSINGSTTRISSESYRELASLFLAVHRRAFEVCLSSERKTIADEALAPAH
jgi:hypothetical protein